MCCKRVQLEPSLLNFDHRAPMTACLREGVKPSGQATRSSQSVKPTGRANRSSQLLKLIGQSKYPHKASFSSVRHVTSLDPLIINRNLPWHNIAGHCGLPNIYNSIFTWCSTQTPILPPPGMPCRTSSSLRKGSSGAPRLLLPLPCCT